MQTGQLSEQFKLAFSYFQNGQCELADYILLKILESSPDHFDSLLLRGIINVKKNTFIALELVTKATNVNPNNPYGHYNLGIIFEEQKLFDKALDSYECTVRLRPDFADAWLNLGNVLHALMNLDDAVRSYDFAIRIKPDFALAYYNRGVVLKELNRFEEAKDSYDNAIRLRPDFADAYCNRAVVLEELNRFQEAVENYDIAIRIKPDFALAYYNRGVVLKELNRFEEAKDSYDNAIRLRPDFADAYCNRAVVLEELNRFQEAVENYDIAIRIKPDFATAKFNKSINLLLNGNLKEGFGLYESRWEKRDPVTKRKFDQPLWLGKENIEGKTILIHSEQGLGDSIQFSRYLELMHKYEAKVLFEVPKPLYGLFKNSKAPYELLQKNDPLPYFDYHCPLLSLPLIFKTELSNIPGITPYFFSNPEKNNYWAFQLGKKTKPRIGIVWSGDVKNKKDQFRSMKLDELVSRLPVNFEYISLQKEVGEHDVANLKKYNIKHFGDQLHDFTDTASLIECMDLVISVDTSVAHLSASLGKETWILISFIPDFRWFLGRDDSPWYRSVSLYRQKNDRQWAPVLERMSTNLLNTNFDW